jgi:prophage regulatory protein
MCAKPIDNNGKPLCTSHLIDTETLKGQPIMNHPVPLRGAEPVPAAAAPRDRLIRIADVERIAGIRKSLIYQLQREGKFPRCVQITPRAVAWAEQAVYAWVEERKRHAEQGPQRA